MDTAIFIARRIAAQSILLSEEAVEKLASILIRTELKKGALFLSEGEVCTQLGYVYKGMVRQFYFKNKKELTEHFASEDNIFICIESFLRQRPANLLVRGRWRIRYCMVFLMILYWHCAPRITRSRSCIAACWRIR